jgi:hypothetical protein
VGRSIPIGGLTVDRLRDAVRTVLGNPAYRERASQLRTSIEAADGLNRAADLIGAAFGSNPRAVPSDRALGSQTDRNHRSDVSLVLPIHN